jgi:hypothetical protein
VGGQARDQKRLGRSGDYRCWQARAAGRGAYGRGGRPDVVGAEDPARRTRATDPSDPNRGIYHLRSCLRDCQKLRRLRDRRTRKVQTLFGTVSVDAPRISVCPCKSGSGLVDVSLSPLAELLPDRCTPELRRLQAELGARHSYREAARLLGMLLPCGPVNHATMRKRTQRVAADLEAAVSPTPEPDPDLSTEIVMVIDGAHIRAAHGYQSRYIDVTVGKIEVAGKPPRRFALAPKGAVAPLATLRKALREQGLRPGRAVTVLSDGEWALPNLVRAAVDEPVACILDWWHISMRVQHIEQAMRGVYALEPRHRAGLEIVEWRIGRLRHLIWNGYHVEASEELFGLRHIVSEVAFLNGERFRSAIARFLWNCDDLRRYLANKRMRWSPRGAHCVATVRAAVFGRPAQNSN